MHRSRQWIILTLLGLVGLGPIGSGELLAQKVQSVNIKKGGKLKIGDGFLVDVTVQDFDQDPQTDVVVFLVALTKDSGGKVTDTLLVESGYNNDVRAGPHSGAPATTTPERAVDGSAFLGGSAADLINAHPKFAASDAAPGDATSIAPCSAANTPITGINNSGLQSFYCGGGSVNGVNNPFAAYRERGDVSNADTRNTSTDTTSTRLWWGDVDSLHVTGTDVKDDKIATREHRNKPVGETYLFRWYASVSYIMGEHDEIYAAAFVTDGNSTANQRVYSDIVLSGNSMMIDGDRPVQGEYLHFSRAIPAAGASEWGFKAAPGSGEPNEETPTDPDEDQGPDGLWHPDERDPGEYHPVSHAGLTYAAEFKGGDLRIASGFGAITGVPADEATAVTALLGAGKSNTDRIVLGIQDTLIAYVNLSESQYSRIRTNDAADWDIVLTVGGQRSTADARSYLAGPAGPRKTVLQHKDAIAENEYGDLTDESLVLTAFIEDSAGNKAAAATIDGAEVTPATCTTAILIDGIKPSLASRASGTGVSEIKVGGKTHRAAIKQADDGGDTLIFAPMGGDRLSGGGPNRDYDLPADENALVYIPNETLGELKITMKSKLADRPDVVVKIEDGLNFGYAGLKTDHKLSVDLSSMITAGTENDSAFVWRDKDGRSAKEEYEGAGRFAVQRKAGYEGSLLADGKADYVFDFVATDIAGNEGPKETRSGVTLDMKDIGFVNSFPIMPGNKDDMDVLGAASANVSVELNKAADTLAVIYKHLGPGSEVAAKNDTLTIGGDGLAKDTFTELTVTGLEDGKKYYVRIDARDSAGNWTQAGPDTFTYDADHELAPAASFDVSIAQQSATKGHELRGFKDDNKDDLDDDKMLMINAGKVVLITLQAQTSDNKTAFLYRKPATLTVMGGQGVDLVEKQSPGATQSEEDEKVITLDDNGWGSDGKRTLAVRNTVSDVKLVFSFQGEGVTGAFVLRDTVKVEDDIYAKLLVDGPSDPVTRGDDFTVSVSIADSFDNVREKDSRFVNVTADQIGAVVPSGDVPISNGTGSFIANSGRTGTFTTMKVTVRDIVQKNGSFIFGVSGPITVEGDPIDPGKPPVDPPVSIDAPDTLIAEDFMGALGEGDQGGFVILTFDTSDDHDIIDGYRIYREVMVSYVLGEDGSIMEAEDNTTRFVPWGYVDAVPDPDLMRVVVATLDTNTTSFQVAAEYVMPASKQAFMPGANQVNPYEVMARTMAESREIAAQPQAADGPLFATLSPEAVAFATKGVVPLMKQTAGNVHPSGRVLSNPVRAVDNIPPGAIPYLRVLDTPGDAGGSITVSWAKSPDDHMVNTSVGQAVGVKIYETAGVKGYNVYRKIGDAAYDLIGHAAGGATSYEDDMVFNGIRYTYQVRPYDTDNVGDAIVEKTALAIRNRVFDADGEPVFGLFGTDNEVGFDDFFIFADQYGLTAENEEFEPAFDLNPDNKIDLYDFFAFADFFGRSIEGVGKTLPAFMAGLNSDARFYLDTGDELPRVGEEMIIAVSLQDFVELKGYGLSVSYDPELLSFVGTEVENSILGTGEFAEGQLVSNKDGLVSLAAYGDVGTEGDLGLNLVFRSLREIEDSYVEILDGELRDGNYGLNSLDSPVSVRIQTRPEVYALRNNYPNPFNPETTLKYDLPEAGDVTLEVYNMLGQVVRTLVNERQSAGRYAVQWDATNDRGQSMSSGIYFYRVQVGGEFTDVKKMLLLK